MSGSSESEKIVREIKRKTRRKYSSEEKIRIVLEGLRGESSIAEICRKEGINPNLCKNKIGLLFKYSLYPYRFFSSFSI